MSRERASREWPMRAGGWVSAIGLGMWFVVSAALAIERPEAIAPGEAGRLARTLPGEFERQDAILLAWDGDNADVRQALVDVVAAIGGKAAVIMLVRTAHDERRAAEFLQQAGVRGGSVCFFQMPYDTVWTRDYGPMLVRGPLGAVEFVDADYERGARPDDDEVALLLAERLNVPIVTAPLTLEGGNLLSNGAGLCLTTTSLLEQNVDRGYGQERLTSVLREAYGVRDVVYLEPLAGETTGHVDMFATFTARDTVVIGEYSHEEDPGNAAILDRNAQRLAGMQTPAGPLRVVRIPMPPSETHQWRTYTNVLYANGRLLVPAYPGRDPQGLAAALSVYRMLLPGWKVVPVDSSTLISLGGGVHCISMNLPCLPRLPLSGPARPAGPLESGFPGLFDRRWFDGPARRNSRERADEKRRVTP